DADRVYISGSSGGGRVCSHVMIANADVFTGGFPLIGCNPYRDMRAADGAVFPTMLKSLSKPVFDLARKRSRLVFYTGEKDFNREQVRGMHAMCQSDGFQHLTLLDAPGAAHATPDAAWF